ncbi:MAG TPA: metal ABC transporter permease [Candidatus Thiothrix moscowensis]|uniref:metal ABC transporter permease n=1 Tax=unclassified Thiothrix TaxID=2636184 RepID=UPI0025DC640E|nr:MULTISPECIES: metal ABC transporter permease [unclassified Thiothrix]HRJ52747.1 metal ABC transporter permease [Candidatus Thiothrix moscowensis]HRJ92769.1 metal ABC transporter permease [Candidatus Thiothrix moscowensis]
MDWSLQLSILAPALAAGLLVLATHIPLGREVLRRGIIFIDLAIAQIAAMGVIAAHSLDWDVHGWETQAVALSAALTGAVLLGWAERHLQRQQEALIGIVFVLSATGGLLLLADNPHGGEHLRDLLSGQILWVNWVDLLPLALLATIFWLVSWLFPARLAAWLTGKTFYLLFAVVITVAVQVIGVYLVFASLVIPALAVVHDSQPLRHAFLPGVLGYGAGIVVSVWLDLPTGASIVWCLALAGLGYRLSIRPT